MHSNFFPKGLLRNLQKCVARVLSNAKEKKYRSITKDYDLKGYKRAYLFHIRKTGGTSLNNMFLSLSGDDPTQLYSSLSQTPNHRLLRNGKIFVGWNVKYITQGAYYYAFSHTPFHMISLPEKTFTVSCFRDPVKRVLSHYNMLMDFLLNNINHPCLKVEGKWLGRNFDDFLLNTPREHLLNQIYMFSSHFDICEAVSNVKKLSHFMFTDDFDNGIISLNNKTGLNLIAKHIRKTTYRSNVSEKSLARLREIIDDEYIFLDKIRQL